MRHLLIIVALLVVSVPNLFAESLLDNYSIRYEYEIKAGDEVVKKGVSAAKRGETSVIDDTKPEEYVSDCVNKRLSVASIGTIIEFAPDLVTDVRANSSFKFIKTDLVSVGFGKCQNGDVRSSKIDKIFFNSTIDKPQEVLYTNGYTISVKQTVDRWHLK